MELCLKVRLPNHNHFNFDPLLYRQKPKDRGDRCHEEDQAGVRGRGRAQHRHQRDLPPEGAPASQHRVSPGQMSDVRHILGSLYNFSSSWQDVLMQEAKLYLIFEFLTMDLKKYMDTNIPKDGQMDPKLTKSYLYQVTFASKR